MEKVFKRVLVITLLSNLLSKMLVKGQFTTESCGTSKTCWRSVADCTLSEPNCLFFSSAWNATSSTFFMEMSGSTGSSQYSGVAFSPTGTMIDSDLYVCTGSSFISGVIRGRQRPPLSDSLPTGVTSSSQTVNNGVAACTFNRPASVTKEVSNGVMRDFNLIQSNFFVLQAFGAYSNNELSYHQTNRWASSQAINFSDPSSTNMQTTSSMQTTSLTTAATSSAESPTLNCNTSSKGCFTNPEGCTPLSDSPCMFASWTTSDEGQNFDFEIIGGTPNTANQYVAIAFGTLSQMKNADLYYCSESALSSGVIRERRQTPVALNNMNGISNVVTRVESGVIRCSFTRVSSVTKEVSNQMSVDFDLSSREFFLLMAIGETSGGQLTRHGNTINSRIVTSSEINFINSASTVDIRFKLLTFLSAALVLLSTNMVV